jgi:hypothetical protein
MTRQEAEKLLASYLAGQHLVDHYQALINVGGFSKPLGDKLLQAQAATATARNQLIAALMEAELPPEAHDS